MKIKKLMLGSYQTNCYVVSNDNNECIVVDPGDIGKKVKNYLEENSLSIKAILLTHGHFDHIGAVDYLYNEYQCDVYIHEEGIEMLHDANLNLSTFKQPFTIQCPIKAAESKMVISNMHVEWLFLPGHCIGSSMILVEDVIFSGDVLFRGSIGRYDFITSSKHDTMQSIEKIKLLDKDYTIYPGHGEITTLFEELKFNPYFN